MISFSGLIGASNNGQFITVAVFRDSTFIGATMCSVTAGGNVNSTSVLVTDAPATTSSVTYSLRIGTNANTWYINRRSVELTFGGMNSGWSIQEI